MSGTSSAKTTAKPLWGKITSACAKRSQGTKGNHVRAQVPVDVAVEEPRAGVVGEEPDGDIVAHVAVAHDVADDGVYKVVRRIAGAADDVEGMSMQVNGVLSK